MSCGRFGGLSCTQKCIVALHYRKGKLWRLCMTISDEGKRESWFINMEGARASPFTGSSVTPWKY